MTSPPGSEPAAPPPTRLALALAVVLGIGAMACVLVAVPSPLFDLDRFAAPKEVALLVTALVAGLLLLARAGEHAHLGITDTALAAFTGWSAVSVLLSTNRWIGLRALAITAAGLVIHLASRRAARDGAGPVLRAFLVVALAAAALTGLAQTYGVSLPLLAESRAPGGTLGNRNFLAHLMAIGLPVAGLALFEARGRIGAGLAAAALGLMTAVTVLSRSRAAWLGVLAALGAMGLAAAVARGMHGPLA
ncbi:MAG: hypothetical protein ACRENB_10880, partial [Gemmatimonadales bacterium]